MPCKIKIKQNLESDIRKLSIEGLGIPYEKAKQVAIKVNKLYGEGVLRYSYSGTQDLIEANVTISNNLVDTYFKHELLVEIAESRAVQKADAKRAGEDYTDNYLFQKSETDELKYKAISLEPADIDEHKSRMIAVALGNKFAAAFGMNYKIISRDEASEVLKNSETPYDGQGAFFINKSIYFVEGNFNVNSVIHEYGHPLIKGIAQTNKKLFNNLYNQLSITDTGMTIINDVKSKYPNLKEGTDRFKEEVLVRALEKDASDKVADQVKTDQGFKDFINKLLYAIKQAIKSIIGKKVNLGKLSSGTRLGELADMLVNEDFIIEDLNLEYSDFAEFKAEYQELIDSLLKNKDNQFLIDGINAMHEEVSFELNSLENAPWKLKEDLKEDSELLRNIKRQLRGYQTKTNLGDREIIEAGKLEQDELKSRATALVNSINELFTFASKLENVLLEMKKKKTHLTDAGITKLQYYKQFLSRQTKFLNSIRRTAGLAPGNPLSTRIMDTYALVSDSTELVKELSKEFTSEFFVENVSEMAEHVEELMKQNVNTILSVNKIDQEKIDDIIKLVSESNPKPFTLDELGLPADMNNGKHLLNKINEYYQKRLNKSVIDSFLSGEEGDLDILQAMILPISNIDDPITGGLIRFLKKKLSNIQNDSLRQQHKIKMSLEPKLKAVGYNPSNTTALGDMVLTTDTVATRDKDGNLVKHEVYSFKNQFGNGWRYDYAIIKDNLEKAIENGDAEATGEAYDAKIKFEEDYMNRPFTDDFYEAQKIWRRANVVQNPITKKSVEVSREQSIKAYQERAKLLNKMGTYSNVNYEEGNENAKKSEYEVAKSEYDQLYNIYTLDGKAKTGDELNRVLVRMEHKKRVKDFYDYTTNDKKLQDAFNTYIRENFTDLGKEVTEDTDKIFMDFQEKNMKTSYTDLYYKEKNELTTELNEISARSKESNPGAAELASLYSQRSSIISWLRDKHGVPDGTKMSANYSNNLKEIEEKIVLLQDEYDTKTGLSKTEAQKLKDYTYRVGKKGEELSAEDNQEYTELLSKSNSAGMNKADQARFNQIIADLSELSEKKPTDAYEEAFNDNLKELEFHEEFINDSAASWLETSLDEALAESKLFAEWFHNNHFQKFVWDRTAKTHVEKWVRTAAWTKSEPKEAKYYKTTELINPITKQPITLKGVANSTFSVKTLKNKYLTISREANREDFVGTIIDNKNNYLPKSDGKDDKYIDKEYLKLKSQNNAQYKLLEEIKKNFLEAQANKPTASKLYLDFPRFRQRDNLELLQSGKGKNDLKRRADAIKASFKSTFTKSKDDYEDGHNFSTDALLVSTDLEGKEISRVPIAGIYGLERAEVSTDVTRSMYRYIQSLNEQEGLISMQAPMKTINDVFQSEEARIKDLTRASKQLSKSKGIMTFLTSNENRRANLVDFLIERSLHGQATSGFEDEHRVATKVANLMMNHASRAFIALDVTSALKNRYGMMLQSMIEASGGKFLSGRSLAKGRGWSMKTVGYLMSKGIYEKGALSLELQITEQFDPITGKTRKDFGKSSSRSFMKDLVDMTWMYDFRRLTDLEAGLQVFGGMMYKKHIPQIQKDGKEKLIPYMDAFELNADKQMVLKPGIDPSYGSEEIEHTFNEGDTWESLAKTYSVTVEELQKRNKNVKISVLEPGDSLVITKAEKFNDFKLKIQGVGKKLNGQIDQVDDSQANKYLGYRLFTFYKRFAIPMFLNRFQADLKKENRWGEVYDWDLGETSKGYYIEAIQALKKVLFDSDKYMPIMTDKEKTAIKKMVSEGAFLAVLGLAVTILFGYDPGDEDRFEKMREREEKYGTAGWLSNHILYQLKMVKMENESFIPLPFVGLNDWVEFSSNTTIATGPTVGVWLKIIQDLGLMAIGSDSARYKQDSGPYPWQEEGSYKLWNHLFGLYGVKGKNYSPITAMKKAEMFEDSKLR